MLSYAVEFTMHFDSVPEQSVFACGFSYIWCSYKQLVLYPAHLKPVQGVLLHGSVRVQVVEKALKELTGLTTYSLNLVWLYRQKACRRVEHNLLYNSTSLNHRHSVDSIVESLLFLLKSPHNLHGPGAFLEL